MSAWPARDDTNASDLPSGDSAPWSSNAGLSTIRVEVRSVDAAAIDVGGARALRGEDHPLAVGR